MASGKQAEQTGHLDLVHRVLRSDGSYRHVHALARAETDAAGKLVRLAGTLQDITDIMEFEGALRQERDRAQSYLDTIQTVMLSLDPLGKIIMINGRGCDLLGYSEEDLLGQNWFATCTPQPSGMEERLPAFLRVMSGEQEAPEYLENQVLCQDGSERLIAWHHAYFYDDGGYILSVLSSGEDITERRKAEQALYKARDEAERANRAKSEFLASMSHELRTPMNAILGFAQLLEYDESLSDEQKDDILEIRRAGSHLLELINEVLDLSRIESGRIDLTMEPVELFPVIEECMRLIGTLAEKRGIRLSHSAPEGLVVKADRKRLKQALLNLLSNAIKYNQEQGSVTLEIQDMGGETVRILVSDTGPGIPAARLEEVFQPFNRLDAKSSEIEGTGIGLSLTRSMLELMDGEVGVASEVGVGSTFWLELPVDPSSDRVSERKEASEAAAESSNDRGPGAQTVLYIEDNLPNQRLVAQILGLLEQVSLLTAGTPEFGMELARKHRPELILLDINLRGMDGYQVLEVLRQEEEFQHTPVIAITANTMPADFQRAKEAGFAQYLTKPLDIGKFLEAVTSCLAE